MRRSGQPSLPSAMTCCLFDSFKTLLMPTQPTKASSGFNVRNVVTVGRFSGDYHWPLLGDYRGTHQTLSERHGTIRSGKQRVESVARGEPAHKSDLGTSDEETPRNPWVTSPLSRVYVLDSRHIGR